MSQSDSELNALIDLLDDDQIYPNVRERLLEHGSSAIPYLRDVVHQKDRARISRATSLLKEIHDREFENEWIEALLDSREKALDLERMVWLVVRIGYPTVDVEFYTEKVEDLAEHTRSRIRATDSEIDKVRRLIGVIANTFCYTGNTANYYEADNSFLNRVLDRKVGIPISLSVLYLLVARRVEIPLAGVGIPGHFMLKYVGHESSDTPFVDPFYAGRMLGRAAVQRFCIRTGAGFRQYYLDPVSDTDIVERILRNLVIVYTRDENQKQLHRMHRLLNFYSEYYVKPEDE